MRGGRDLPYGKVRRDWSRRNGCPKPDTAVSRAGRAESSSDFSSSATAQGLVNYSEKCVPVAVVEDTSSSTWQEDLATK